MKCKNCGAQLMEGVVFCCECGAKVEKQKRICKKCGFELEDGIKFCTNCGENTDPIKESEQSRQQKGGFHSIQEKMLKKWMTLTLFYIIAVVEFCIIAILFLAAVFLHKGLPIFLSIVQILGLLVAVLMDKDIINTKKTASKYMVLTIVACFTVLNLFSFFVGHKNISVNDSQGERDDVQITTEAKKYNVDINVHCAENLLFSKYDVRVYLDYDELGIIEHGTDKEFSVSLEEGIYEIEFEDEENSSVDGIVEFEVDGDISLTYNITCEGNQIKVEPVDQNSQSEDDDSVTEEEQQSEAEPEEISEDISEDNLTIDNCPELAQMLENKADYDESYADFASTNYGKNIEFDGRIDYCANYGDYETRYDYLVSAGDYAPDSQRGPSFKFENVNWYDLNTDLDTVSVGLNVHIVAKVDHYDENSGLFYLIPVSVTGR